MSGNAHGAVRPGAFRWGGSTHGAVRPGADGLTELPHGAHRPGAVRWGVMPRGIPPLGLLGGGEMPRGLAPHGADRPMGQSAPPNIGFFHTGCVFPKSEPFLKIATFLGSCFGIWGC